MKLDRKIKHNENVCHAHDLGSRSQPGIKVIIRDLRGAFVTYCNISCFDLSEDMENCKISEKNQENSGKVREFVPMRITPKFQVIHFAPSKHRIKMIF